MAYAFVAGALAAKAIVADALVAKALVVDALVANVSMSILIPLEAKTTHMHQLSSCLRKPPNLFEYHSGYDDVYSVEEICEYHHVPEHSLARGLEESWNFQELLTESVGPVHFP